MTGGRRWAIPAFAFIVISILARTAVQILFKQLAIGDAGASYVALLTSPLFYLVCFLLLLLTWSWQQALSYYSLNFAYPFTSVVFVTLLVSGAVFFDEIVTANNIYGSAIIIVGVVMIAGDSASRAPRA